MMLASTAEKLAIKEQEEIMPIVLAYVFKRIEETARGGARLWETNAVSLATHSIKMAGMEKNSFYLSKSFVERLGKGLEDLGYRVTLEDVSSTLGFESITIYW